MDDQSKTKQQLMDELKELRQRVSQLEVVEEALRESEAQYRRLFEDAILGVFRSTPQGTYEEVNPAFARMFGYDSPEEMKQEVTDIRNQQYVRPEDRDTIQRILASEGFVKGFEEEALRKDGESVWVSINVTPVFDQSGTIVSYEGTSEDITQRKQAENNLRESEEKYRSVVDNMQDVFYRTDMQGTITMVSPSGPEMIGYESVDQIIGLNVARDFYKNPDERDRMLATLREKGEVRNYEVELVRRDGNSIIVSTSSHIYYDKSGQPLGIEGVFTDITARKQAEHALRESEEKYRRIVENTQHVIYQTDMDGRITFLSPRSEQVLGYTPDESLGRRLTGLYALPEERIRLLNLLMENGSVTDFEAELSRKDGSRVWVSTNARLLRDEEGNPIGVEGVSRDVTTRKIAEAALRESEQRLSQIINFLPDATVAVDREGTVIAWNRAIEEMTGVPAEEMMGKANYEYALPFYGTRRPILLDLVLTPNEEMRQTYSLLTADRNVLTVETDNATPLGENTVLWAKASALYDMHGTVIGAIESIRDITDRKKAEEALRKSEALLNSIIEQSPFSMFICDNEGTLIKINPACKKWVRVTDEDVVGKYNLLKDEAIDAQGLMPLVRSVFENGEQANFELDWDSMLIKHLGHKEAFKLSLYVTIFPVKDAEGRITNAVCQHLDISDRKQAKEALRESEEKYRAVFDNAGIGIDLLDRDGRIVKVNKALLNILGYAEEELRQLTFLEITHPDDKEISKQNLEALIAGDIDSYRLEKRYLRKDGSIVWVDLWSSAVRDANGEYEATVAVIEDITQRKLAEHALQESEQKYRRLHETMMDAFVSVDMTGRIQETNLAYQAMLGYSEEELRRLTYLDLTPEQWHTLEASIVEEQILVKGYSDVYQKEYRKKDGTIFPVEVRTFLVPT